MNEIEVCNPKQDRFCVLYTTIGAETFGNGTKSAIAAGYSEKSAYSQACNLLKNPKIQQRIRELHKENMRRNNVTTDSVLANIEHDRMLARQKGDISSAIRADELQGKYLAMFTDNINRTEEGLTMIFSVEKPMDNSNEPDKRLEETPKLPNP
jgi:phage terminase small subunit